jgi:membrane peptidoglycan carboxypeptidase
MLQGVVARGTARAIGPLSAFVGGKTGTSEDENDAWFVGFTNDVTVGIWIGYDNADGKRRTLGDGQTGGKVAVPVFEPIVEAVWATYARKTPLYAPSPTAARELIALPIDLNSGNRLSQRQGQAFTEYFRLKYGRLADTQYLLVSSNERFAARDPGDGETFTRGAGGGYGRGTYSSQGGYYQGGYYQGGNYQGGNYQGGPSGRGFVQGSYDQGGSVGEMRPRYSEDRRWAPPTRVDPDVPWRDRQRSYW